MNLIKYLIKMIFRKRSERKFVKFENKFHRETSRIKPSVENIEDLINQKYRALNFNIRLAHVKIFIEIVGLRIVKHLVGTSLFPSVAVAQAAIESAWGKSADRSLFGIKGKGTKGSWTGKTKEHDGEKMITIVDSFRNYHTYDEAIVDYRKLLMTFPRYKPVCEARNFQEACKALQTTGYATDPKYATKLIRIIVDFNLVLLDDLLL